MSSVESWRRFLTTDEISKASGGRIQPLSEQAAAGFMGNLAIESGRGNLANADVVEHGSGAGRGIIQATGPRRKAYDAARNDALARGIDPNSDAFQQQYIVDEYVGKYDKLAGGSLSGYTGALDPKSPVHGMSADQAAEYFSNNYFRPGVPHLDRRKEAALGFASGKTLEGGPTPATRRAPGAARGVPGAAPEAGADGSFEMQLAQQLLERSTAPMAAPVLSAQSGDSITQALLSLSAPRAVAPVAAQSAQASPWDALLQSQRPTGQMGREQVISGGRSFGAVGARSRRFAGQSLLELAGYG